MKFNKAAICAVILLILCVFLIAFFCIIAFSTSYGYSVQNNKNSSPVGNFDVTSRITVIIDAGHGGIDPGAVANNLVEKDINLAVAKKLKDFLSLSGYNVLLTREEDVALCDANKSSYKRDDLERRLSLVETTDNCGFVSIHMNKFELESAGGLQTFYSPNNSESLKLAECIQTASKVLDPNNKRAVKSDDGNIFILKNTFKPAVLVECGFLSNPNDAANLSDPVYQNKLAYVLYAGIINYLGE